MLTQPGEWRLKPRERGSEYEKYDNWQLVEFRLHAVLAEAAGKLNFTVEQRLPYIASATEQEIAAGVLGVKEAPEHVFCFFRSLDDLPQQFSAPEFLALVEARLEQEYPDGLSKSSQKLVKEIQETEPDSSAKDFADRIKEVLEHTPKATPEEEAVNFVQQVLVDFTARDFENLDEKEWTVDEEARNKQNNLKKRLQKYVPQNVFPYQARWTGDGITKDHINQLCEDVYNSLSRLILDEIEHPHEIVAAEEEVVHIRPDEALDAEGLAHHKFAEERLRFFVGRKEMLANIADYLSNSGRRSLAIVGAGGTGKSALMARAIQQTQESHPKAAIVYRFIGATPGSSDGRSLLGSLCREISRRYGADEAEVPTDYRELVPELGKRMQLASADRPLILFLDSLDQLSASQDARSLIWLPNELPEHVSVIASTREEDTLKALRSKQAHEKELGGLSRQEGDDLLSQWLASPNIHRTLQAAQRKEVLDKFEQSKGNPLYLKLAFEEARLWTSGSGQPPEQLETGVKGIIDKNMIDRLKNEGSHGEALVSHALGYLAASRYGLAEDELLDLLSRDLRVYEWFFKKSFHLPADLVGWAIQYRRSHPTQEAKGHRQPRKDEERAALAWLKEIRTPPEKVGDFLSEVLPKVDGPRLPVVLWSRLSFDLAPYLTERMVDGSPLLNFYHRELGDVATAVFLAKGKDQPYHASLADYFRRKADPERDDRWNGPLHCLTELSYHLFASAQQRELAALWTSIPYLDARASNTNVYELIREYLWLREPGDAPREYHDMLVPHAQRLSEHRGLFFGLLRHEGSAYARECCDELVRSGQWYKPWIRTEQVWLPALTSEEQTLSVAVGNSFRFDESTAAAMNDPVSLVFYVKRLGKIGVADPVAGREYPIALICRQTPIWRLCASSDGRRLGVAYADGNADLLAIEFAPDGSWLKQSTIAAFRVLVPELELPFLCWGGDRLLCQKEDGGFALISSSGEEERLVIPNDCRGELSGAVMTNGHWIITLRQGPDTRILACSNRHVSFSMLRPASDVTAITSAGHDRVAIGFSDNHLVLFRVSDSMVNEKSLQRRYCPICAAGCEDRLIWMESDASAYSWNPDGEKLPLQLRAPGVFSSGLSFYRPSKMVLHSDDTLWVLTQSSIHSLTTITANPPGFPVCEVLIGATGAIYPIQKRGDNYWVVNSMRRRECCVVNRNPVRQYFAMNERNQLLAVTDTGGAVWTDLETLESVNLPSMPPAVNSVAPAGDGFWLADRFGGIFHLGRDKVGAEIVRIPLSSLAGGALCSWPGTLLWHGISSEKGDSNLYLMFFTIPMDTPGNLKPWGQRVITKPEGVFQAVCHDAATGELILIITGPRYGLCAKVGTPKQFLSHEERAYDLDIGGGITHAAMSPRGAAVFLLSNTGKIFVLDRTNFRTRSTLISNGRFTLLAGGFPGRGPLAVVESGWRVFTCDEGDYHEQ